MPRSKSILGHPRPPLRPRAERRALIDAPFPVVRVHVDVKKSHGGCLIPDPLEDIYPKDTWGDKVRRTPHRLPHSFDS